MSADNEKTDNNLETLLRQLAEARQQYESQKTEANDLIEAVRNSGQYRDLVHINGIVAEQINRLSDSIRNIALVEYEFAGQKTINEAVKVRIVNDDHLNYEPDEAKSWALKMAPRMVVLDKKAFEKYARQVADGPMALDFVGIEALSYPQATIASDLSEWLP